MAFDPGKYNNGRRLTAFVAAMAGRTTPENSCWPTKAFGNMSIGSRSRKKSGRALD